MDSVLTARPAAIRTFSTWSVSFLPPASLERHAGRATVALVTFAPAMVVIPRFR